MLTANAQEHLERRAAAEGKDLTALTAAEAIDLMLRWYETEPVTDVVDDDGDALLFQWGTYPGTGSGLFEYDITRQLVVVEQPDDEQDAVHEEHEYLQLSLTLHFPLTAETQALGSGSAWCFSRSETAALRQVVADSPATTYVARCAPARVTLDFFDAC